MLRSQTQVPPLPPSAGSWLLGKPGSRRFSGKSTCVSKIVRKIIVGKGKSVTYDRTSESFSSIVPSSASSPPNRTLVYALDFIETVCQFKGFSMNEDKTLGDLAKWHVQKLIRFATNVRVPVFAFLDTLSQDSIIRNVQNVERGRDRETSSSGAKLILNATQCTRIETLPYALKTCWTFKKVFRPVYFRILHEVFRDVMATFRGRKTLVLIGGIQPGSNMDDVNVSCCGATFEVGDLLFAPQTLGRTQSDVKRLQKGYFALQSISKVGQGELMCSYLARLLDVHSTTQSWSVVIVSRDADSIVAHAPAVSAFTSNRVNVYSLLRRRKSKPIFKGLETTYFLYIDIVIDYSRFSSDLVDLGYKGGWLDIAASYCFIVNDVIPRTAITLAQFLESLLLGYSTSPSSAHLAKFSKSTTNAIKKGVELEVTQMVEILKRIWHSKLKSSIEITKEYDSLDLTFLRGLD